MKKDRILAQNSYVGTEQRINRNIVLGDFKAKGMHQMSHLIES